MTANAKRPLITANRVTAGRLLFLPVLIWMLYQPRLWPVALVTGALVALTDFLDGSLARKYGPTVLGGLLDPIADKMFIAAWYLPFTDLGILPGVGVALLFVREFLITGLRSAFEQRGLAMKTSYLAKIKTWVQMEGVAALMAVEMFPRNYVVLGIAAMCAGPLLFGLVKLVVKRKVSSFAFIMAGFTGVLLSIVYFGGELAVPIIAWAIVGFTWIAAFDYLWAGLPQLLRKGGFSAADGVRVFGALAIPPLVFAAMLNTFAPFVALLVVMVCELSVGGLDNLLSHSKDETSTLAWGVRVGGVAGFLGAALWAHSAGHYDLVAIFSYVAAGISAVGAIAEFWRGRAYYLESKYVDKALA